MRILSSVYVDFTLVLLRQYGNLNFWYANCDAGEKLIEKIVE